MITLTNELKAQTLAMTQTECGIKTISNESNMSMNKKHIPPVIVNCLYSGKK